MNIKQVDASNAYASALNNAQMPGIANGDSMKATSPDDDVFASLVNNSLGAVSASSKNLEMTSAKVLAGQASMVDVVTAATKAEMVVETVVAVRDKVIRAYDDILKMPL